MRIPIKDLEEICRKHGLSKAILLAHHPESNSDHVVTWGRTIDDCSQAADFGNSLKDHLGWPDSLHAQPARVRRLQARIKELEAELAQYRQAENATGQDG